MNELSPAQKFRLALDMYEVGEQMQRQRLRRERPDASEVDIERAVVAWLTEQRAVDGFTPAIARSARSAR